MRKGSKRTSGKMVCAVIAGLLSGTALWAAAPEHFLLLDKDGGKAVDAFARQNGAKPGASISYVVRQSGPTDGPHPGRNSAVKLQYEGRFLDGTIFDDAQGKPVIFPVRAVVPGFQQALLMMRPGDEWEVMIPPDLAYGRNGSPLSGRVLIFKIKLIETGKDVPASPPILSEMPK
jgi:FKBP-type peptidyl-prolyl cis-trans isomerase